MDIKPKFHARKSQLGDVIELFYMETINGGAFAPEPIKLRPKLQHEITSPMMTLSPEVAQNLMNELWLAGVRPADAKEQDGELEATKMHLADMRRLVFASKNG